MECDDPFTDLCLDILVFEKHVKVFILGDFNARVGKYQNTEILEENIVNPFLLRESKDCIVTDYGRILIHMLDWTTMIVLNDINVFFLTNLLTCLPVSSGGSELDYVFRKACDLSMVNAFKIGPLSPYSDHKPLYLNLILSHSINKCGKVKEERRYIIRPCYNKAMIYAKEVENHLSKLSLGNDI